MRSKIRKHEQVDYLLVDHGLTKRICWRRERKRKEQLDDARSIVDYEGKSNDFFSSLLPARSKPNRLFRSHIRGTAFTLDFYVLPLFCPRITILPSPLTTRGSPLRINKEEQTRADRSKSILPVVFSSIEKVRPFLSLFSSTRNRSIFKFL